MLERKKKQYHQLMLNRNSIVEPAGSAVSAW